MAPKALACVTACFLCPASRPFGPLAGRDRRYTNTVRLRENTVRVRTRNQMVMPDVSLSMMWLALISTLTGAPAVPAPSPLTIAVHMTHGMSNQIAKDALREASAIWKLGGVTLEWHTTSEPAASGGSDVDVTFDDAPGSVAGPDVPLGWVTVDPSGVPERTIFLSRKNALRLIDAIEAYRERPVRFKEQLIARALGRALAHELGHYLTGSKEHTVSGLMKGRRLADEFFSPACVGFDVNGDERRLAARMLALAAASQRHPPGT